MLVPRRKFTLMTKIGQLTYWEAVAYYFRISWQYTHRLRDVRNVQHMMRVVTAAV
jgi:hypothetical protein